MKPAYLNIPIPEWRAALRYDADVGQFFWRARISNKAAGSIAGKRDSHGYIQIKYRGAAVLAHRLAIAFEAGSWPTALVDHINGCRADNRIANLRQATKAGNNCHRLTPTRAKTGFIGVRLKRSRYQAEIGSGGKIIHLGVFDTPEQAARARDAAAAVLHGDFATLNFPAETVIR